MRLILFLIFTFITGTLLSQQVNTEYQKQIHYADSLFINRQYKPAASAYTVAFMHNNNKGLVEDRYHAAISYALSNNADSAFYNLFRIAEKAGWNKYDRLTSDSTLRSLHKDARWNRLVNKVRANKAEADLEPKGNDR